MAEPEDRFWKLHLSKARGEEMTSAQQTELDAWYAEQDQIEAASLGVAINSGTVEALQEHVDAILKRIIATSQAIQTLAAENEILRRENRALRRQLNQRRALQPI